LGEWKERTLRAHSKSFKAAMEKESGNCPLKAIALAAEVLRRLQGPGNLSKENLVSASIIKSLKDFHSQAPTSPPPPRGGHEGGCAKICWQNHGGLGWEKI
jgi:hypothetical protein